MERLLRQPKTKGVIRDTHGSRALRAIASATDGEIDEKTRRAAEEALSNRNAAEAASVDMTSRDPFATSNRCARQPPNVPSGPGALFRPTGLHR